MPGRRRPGWPSDGLVVDGAGQQVVAGLVGHLDQHLEVGQPVADRGDPRRELGVVDQRAGLGVGEQVDQLLLDVAVVDVERRHPGAVAADHRLEVLVAVAQVDAEVVLAGLVAGELVALGVAAEPRSTR